MRRFLYSVVIISFLLIVAMRFYFVSHFLPLFHFGWLSDTYNDYLQDDYYSDVLTADMRTLDQLIIAYYKRHQKLPSDLKTLKADALQRNEWPKWQNPYSRQRDLRALQELHLELGAGRPEIQKMPAGQIVYLKYFAQGHRCGYGVRGARIHGIWVTTKSAVLEFGESELLCSTVK